MEVYFVLFYQDYSDQTLGHYKNGKALKVNQAEMFKWLQLSHEQNIKIEIYSAKCEIDFS